MTAGAPSGGTSTRRLARQGSANLAGAAVSALAGFAVVVAVARGVGKAEAGVFFAATSLFLLVSTLARLGTPTGLVWAISRYRALGQLHRVRPTLRAAIGPVAVAGLLAAVVLLVATPEWAGVLLRDEAGGAARDEFVAMVRALALFVPVAAVHDAVTAATRGYGSMRATVLVERLGRPALQVVGVGLAVLGSSAVLLAAAWAVPYLPALGIAVLMLSRATRQHAPETLPEIGADGSPGVAGGTASPQGAANTATASSAGAANTATANAAGGGGVAGEFWRFTAPRSLADIAQMASQRLDIVLVGALRGPVAAALYTAATRFLVVGQAAGMALSLSVQPALGGLLARDDREAANRVYRTATAWLVVVTWPLYLAMLVAAPLLLAVFGPGYDAGLPVMVVLAATLLVATACGMVDVVLTMAGRSTWSLYNMLLALGVQVGLDLLLIPRLGILGAAYGWAAAILAKNLVALVQISARLGMHPFGRGVATACALATGCFGVVPALLRPVLGDSPPALVGALALGAAAYLVGLWRLRRVLRLDELPRLRRRGERPARATTNPANVGSERV